MRPVSFLAFATAFTALSAFGATADPGHSGHDHAEEAAYGRPGDPAKGGRVIQVVMKETDSGMAFAPERIEVRQGEQIQFVLRNGGELDHELVIGSVEANRRHAEEMASHPDMAHEDPNAKRLGPKTSGVLRWQFTQAGTFEYACLIPGHREAGMVGTVVVK
ncbi:cupredoxin domain-containing protein [Microvirga arsenatis]|uniref:Copper resistance protein n=1 Tax=Microvirga arsenatis TaxID=2692265 RepID=A0ABW9Z354_9HYPH|nr:cupredoxin family protein [Microvirga arsenatis]NBJ13119.1 copper resistance protein [Microvirga arsenatis]NBJ26870.1 copper resistance protein [Microvirga arsenatis]